MSNIGTQWLENEKRSMKESAKQMAREKEKIIPISFWETELINGKTELIFVNHEEQMKKNPSLVKYKWLHLKGLKENRNLK